MDDMQKGVMGEVRLAFLFGRLTSVAGAEEALTAENDQYGDIVQANFDDSYRNLTLKSLACLHWVINYCPSAKSVISLHGLFEVNSTTGVILGGIRGYAYPPLL